MSLGNKYQIDMCHGPLLSKILLVALPLMAANVIQVLFTVVDMVVIGRYAGKEAMAAVGQFDRSKALTVYSEGKVGIVSYEGGGVLLVNVGSVKANVTLPSEMTADGQNKVTLEPYSFRVLSR